jgi:predicted transcriptional regulators
MEFDDNRPISCQISDYCTSGIMTGRWEQGDRIPSTKELAVTLGVNPRTVMKAYDELAEAGVIFQRRGMGYFVADEAVSQIRNMLRREFISKTVPRLRAMMHESGISSRELVELLDNGD